MSGHEAESAAKDAAAPAKSKFGGKIKILVFVLVGMGLQAVVAMLFFSKGSGQSTGHAEEPAGAHGASHGSGGHGGGGHGGGHDSGHTPTGNPGDLVEAEVGDFSCTVEVEDTATLFYLSFKLHAMVTNGALNTFKDAITGSHKARLRQAVVKVVRMSSIAEIREAQLDLFKRSLTTEMNNVLPQRFINDVVISEVRIIQQ